MCTYKNIFIFLTIVASTYAYPYPEEDYPINSNVEKKNESHEMTPEEVKQSYYEYYKDIKNHNYLEMSQLTGDKTQSMIEQTQSAMNYPAYNLRNIQPPRFYGHFSPPAIEGMGDNTGLSSNNKYFYDNLQPNRHLRSAQNKEEFNINSLDTVVNNNVRDENYRERVKNIREHFKKYMEHYINGEKNAATRHNFEPYYPRQNNNNNNNMIVLKVQDDNDELTAGRDSLGHMNKDDALKFLHIIEGNELLQNSEDTDYRFQIAFGDT